MGASLDLRLGTSILSETKATVGKGVGWSEIKGLRRVEEIEGGMERKVEEGGEEGVYVYCRELPIER